MANRSGFKSLWVRWNSRSLLYVVFLLLMSGCDKPDHDDRVNRTVLIYMAADNDLSDNALRNIEQMKSSYPVDGKNNLLVFVNLPEEKPYLIKIEADTEIVIKQYEEFNSLEVQNMRRVLVDMIGMYPANEYGLVLWSHGSSWLPPNFQTRSFGEEKGLQMDITELSDALPVKFDFILFDACLMGSVEVAYELKDNADYIIASSTETLYTGFPYDMIIPDLIAASPDLQKVAKKYMDYYRQLTGIYRSATISVINTNELEKLAEITSLLLGGNSINMDLFNRSVVQRLDSYEEQYIFDFSDFIHKAFPDSQTEPFDNQLQKVVLYKAHTDEFMGDFFINTYCGLSSYIPLKSRDDLNNYYQRLKWYKDSGYNRLFN
ncbi:MAG: clostripain-related cysteine peptidase [Candidatus Paceibacterota bacterium]|nr:clostripain-related cysteine peptidase [Proteiniphilum sp.]MDY0183066.1 clostripain-related cysteine peptidase [Proteiniphilum sp.]